MTEARNEPNEYRLSFTVGGLFLHEAIATGQVWKDSGDWRQVRSLAPSNLFVAAGVASSAKRLRNEVIRRLQTLEEAELSYLAHCPIDDARALAWISACRTYRILRDFSWEILLEKHTPYAEPVRASDFDVVLDGVIARSDQPISVKDSTRNRLRSVLMRMLREGRLIDEEGRVLTLPISEDLRSILVASPGSGLGGLDCIPGGR